MNADATQKKIDKAVAAETKRCIKAVKMAANDAIEDAGEGVSKDFKRGAKAVQAAAIANINTAGE